MVLIQGGPLPHHHIKVYHYMLPSPATIDIVSHMTMGACFHLRERTRGVRLDHLLSCDWSDVADTALWLIEIEAQNLGVKQTSRCCAPASVPHFPWLFKWRNVELESGPHCIMINRDEPWLPGLLSGHMIFTLVCSKTTWKLCYCWVNDFSLKMIFLTWAVDKGIHDVVFPHFLFIFTLKSVIAFYMF